MNPVHPNQVVKIISIWSKADGSGSNYVYSIVVPNASTPEGVLENAFRLTNQDSRPQRHVCYSTSAGDIMVLNGQHYLVERTGYAKITREQSHAIQNLTSRDTAFGLNYLIRECHVPRVEEDGRRTEVTTTKRAH